MTLSSRTTYFLCGLPVSACSRVKQYKLTCLNRVCDEHILAIHLATISALSLALFSSSPKTVFCLFICPLLVLVFCIVFSHRHVHHIHILHQKLKGPVHFVSTCSSCTRKVVALHLSCCSFCSFMTMNNNSFVFVILLLQHNSSQSCG